MKLTPLAFAAVKACVAALREFPDFNASLDGDNLVLKHYFHIGFAADTPNGLLVPVIRDVDSKGVLEIARELPAMLVRSRARGQVGTRRRCRAAPSPSPSLGGIGGTAFTPIINAPEVAILGVSRAETKPVWDGKEFVPRLMLPLSLSYDHRVIDGAAAARFATYLASCSPTRRRAAGGSPFDDLDVAVPDLGNFDEVAVVEVLVKAGDKVEVDTPLVTLETEKATMDVPSSAPAPFSAVLVKARRQGAAGQRDRQSLARPARPAAGHCSPCRPRSLRAPPPRPRAPLQRTHPSLRRGAHLAAREPRRRTARRCWCWAAAPAATRPRSAPPTSA